MFTKKIFSLLGLLFIGNRVGSVFADECNVENPKDCISNVYYLVNKQDHSLINDTGVSGSLYYCSGGETKICEEQTSVGYYFVDPKTVYVCNVDNGAIQCAKESIPDERNACTEDNIGKLFVKTGDSTASLCLNYAADTPSVVELNGSAKGNYLVYKNSNPIENVFGITGSNEKYAIVGIQDKVVSLNSTYSNGLKYVYVDATKNRVMEKGDKDFPKLTGSTSDPDEDNIMELLCSSGKCKNSDAEVKVNSFTGFSNEEGIYLLKIDGAITTELTNSNIDSEITGSLDKVGLYNCDKELNCERMAGYAWNTGKTKFYKIPASGSAEDISESAGTSHPDSYCTGRLGLVYTLDSVKKICMEDGVGVDIEDNKYYIFGGTAMDSSSPFLSVSNKILKMTADYAVIDDNFKAENNKNYVIKIGNKFYSYRYDESKSGFLRDSELSGVKNYDLHGTGLNIYDEYPLKDTKSITAEIIDNWALFNCKHGECLQTYGYMKSQNEEKYFKYYADGTTPNAMLTTGFAQCSTDGENDLMSHGKLCITHGNDSTRVTGDMTNGNIFVVHTANGDPFYKTSAADLLLEATSNSITISNIYEDDSGVLTHKGKKISSNEITTGDEGNYQELILFDCGKQGTCDRSGGYALKNNEVYSLPKDSTSDEYTVVEAVDCTGNAGKIVEIGSINYICLDNSMKVALSQTGFYVLGNDALAAPLDTATEKKKMIKITNQLIAMDHYFKDTQNDKKYLIEMNGVMKSYDYIHDNEEWLETAVNSVVVYEYIPYNALAMTNIYEEVNLSDTTSITSNSQLGYWNIFDCTYGSCQRTYGYIKSSDALPADVKYFSIAMDDTKQIVATSVMTANTCTSASDVGKLLTDGKLCVVGDASSAIEASMENENYLLSNASGNIFANSASNTNMVIKATGTSFTLAYTVDFNLYTVDNGVISDTVAADFTGEKRNKVGLFKCNSNGVCKNTSGYVYSGTEFFSTSESLGVTVCTVYASTNCSSHVGEFIQEGGKKYFCVGPSERVEAVTTDDQYYIVGSVVNNSKVASNQMVKLAPNYIVLDEKFDGQNYIIRNADQYIAYKYQNGAFEKDTSVSGINTYKQIDNLNIYTLLDVKNVKLIDLDKLFLMNCVEGECQILSGNILIEDTMVKRCDEMNCNNDSTSYVTADCDAVGKVSKVKVNEKKLQMCLVKNAAGDQFQLTDISSSNVYYAGTSVNTYKKILVNSDSTIIEEINPEIGYYFIKNNALSNTADMIIKCTNENCAIENTASVANCNSNDNIGKFNTNKKLCVANRKETAVMGNEGVYLMSFGVENPFGSVIKSGKPGVIKMDATSVKIDTTQTNVCVNDTTYAVSSRSGSTCTAGSTVYTCNNTGSCVAGSSAPTSSVKVLGPCTGVNVASCSSDSIVTYCLHTDGFIYGLKENGSCDSKINTGIHVYDVNTKKEITLGTGFVDSANVDNVVLYACSATGCKQTLGYVKMNTRGSLTLSDPGTTFSNSPTSYCKIDNNGKCNQLADSEAWAEDKFYGITSGYLEITNEGGQVASQGVACDSGKIGLINNEYKLCATGSVVVDYGASASYYLTDNIAPASIFKSVVTSTDGSNGIVITRDTNVIYYNNVKSDTAVKVINITTMQDETLGSSITADAANLRIYECNSGYCSRTTGFVKSSSDYYSVPSDAVSKQMAATDHVSSCSKETSGKLLVGEKLCIGSNELVGFPAAASQFIISDGSSGYKYVRTLDGVISISGAFTGITDSGLYVINKKTGSTVRFPDSAANLDANLSDLALFNCDDTNKICKQTYGYLMSNDAEDASKKYYSIPTSGTNIEVPGANLEDSCSAFGKVSKGTNKGFCYANAKSINFGAAAGANDAYLLTLSASNSFSSGSTGSILVRASHNALTINNLNNVNPGPILINTDTLKKQSLVSSIESIKTKLALYNCARDGTCTRSAGYVTDGTNYFSIHVSDASNNKKSGEDSDTEFMTSCTAANAGKVNKSDGHKICLGSDSVSFPSTGADTHYIASTGSAGTFIRAVEKIITVKDVSTDINTSIVAFNKNTIAKLDLASTAAAINSELPDLALYYCDASTKVCTSTYGYLKSSDDKYFSLGVSGNSGATEGTCGTTSIGALTSTGVLCLLGDVSDAVTFDATPKNYTITGTLALGNPFITEGSNFIVEIGENYMVKNDHFYEKLAAGVHLIEITATKEVKDIDYTNSGTVDANSISRLSLYICKDKICKGTYGYVKTGGDSKYYAIDSSGSQVAETVTACERNIGKLYSNSLCIDSDDSHVKAFATEGSKYYEIEPSSGSIFGSTGKVIVREEKNAFVLENFHLDQDGGHYIVKINDADFKLYTYTSEGSNVALDETTTGIDVYDTLEAGKVFTPSSAISTSSVIYECENGTCVNVDGYALIGGAIKVCGASDCNTAGTDVTATSGTCNASDSADLGKVHIDTTLKLCNKADNAPNNVGSDAYLIKGNIYTSIKENTVIIKKSALAGNYLIDANNKLNNEAPTHIVTCASNGTCESPADVNGKDAGYYPLGGSDKLITCSGTTCSILASAGYYAGVDTKLYLCETDGSCTAVTEPTGHYLDSGNAKNIITCNESHACTSAAGSTAKGHAYIDATDTNGQSVITCNSTNCSKSSTLSNAVKALAIAGDHLYFIDGKENGKIITCSGNANGGSCAAPDVPSFTGGVYYEFYVDGTATSTHTITCTSGSTCISSKALRQTTETDTTAAKCVGSSDLGYFISTNGKLFLSSTGTDACTVQAMEKTYLFKDNATMVELDNNYTGTDSGKIYSCDASHCTQLISKGFFETSYIYSCDEDGICTKAQSGTFCTKSNEALIKPDNEACEDGYTAKTCNEGNRIDSVFSADAECNVFDPTNCISNVYYLVNKQDHSLINDTGVSGSLYYCSGGETKICEEQTSVGYYFVDPKTVYVCRINNSPFQCTKESIPDERNACTEDNIGKLFVKTGDSTASLCLNYAADTPSVVELNGSAKGNYLVYKNSNPIENVFGITGSNEKYAIVGIQDKVVSLNSTYSNGLKYVYVDATKNRVMEKGDKDFPKLTGSTSDPDENNIMELLCNNGGICKDAEREQTFSSFTGFTGAGIYILKNNAGTITKVDNANIADGDLALNIHIYKCDAQINCEKISGYAWNTGRTAIYRIPASGVPSKLTIEDGTITSCNENIGLIYTSSGDNYICMEDGYAAKIENNKYYIFGEGTMYTTHNPFPSVANKIFKMTADYGIIDENYNAENGKNYVVQTGTGVNDYAVYKYYESSDSFIRDSELSGVKNYDLHDTGLNIYDEYPLKDTKSIAEADIANWALFNCKHGECLQTYGYMKSQNEDKYFKYYADGTTDNAMLTTTGFSQCSSDGENGLMSNGKLCITHGNESTRVTGDMSNGNLFVVHSADGDPFYNSAPDDLLLEATSNSITISNIYEGRSGILTHKNQKILSSSITEGTEGNNEKLILYDCEKTGSCERLGGYAINGSKIYSVLKTDSSSKSSIKYNNGVITEVSACSSASSGTIVKIGTENYLCLDNTNKVKLTDYGYYALGNDAFDSGSPFVAGDKKKMIKITEDLIAFDHIYDEFSKCVIKNSDKYTVYSQSSKLYTKASEDSGVFVYNQKNNDNVFVNVVNPASVTNLPDIEKWSLFDCALGNCQRSFGYYKPGTNYFSIAESGINEIFTPSAIEDNHCLLATDAGNLLKDGKLCVVPSSDYDQQKNATMAFGRYLISTDNNSIFTAAHQGESIVVEGKETSFIWKSVSDINIYSVDSGTIGIPDYTTSDDTRAKIGLYKCSSNICKKIDGYAYSDSKYYTIDKSSGASLTSISEGTCDQAASIGKIITKEGVKTLCLGSGASVPIPDRKGRFVVGTVDSGSKLTNNKLINITGSYIVVDDVLEQESTIHFLIKFDSVYIAYKMNTNSKTFSIDNTVSGMKTYQKIDASDDTNVYREITSMSDISYENVSELDLFQCSGGQCKEIPGYVLVSGNEVFKCTGGSCGNAHGGDKVASCTGSDVGKTIIKAAQGNNPANIQLCTGASASIDITNTQAYYIGNNPIKYVGNVEKTVIGLPIPDMGYFLINNNVLVTTPSNDDKLIQCDGTSATCTVITSPNNSCTTANVGKFTSEKKLCLADGKSTAKAIGNTGSYLISSGDSSAFASEVKSPKFGVISMTANSITLDSSKSYICVSNEDLTVTDRTSSSASCSSGKPYSCSKGVCKEGSSAPSSSSIALSSCPDTCASTEAATSLCIDSDGKIHDVDSSGACKSDVLDIGTHVIEINENEVAKKVTLGSKSIDLANAKRLLMFECDADKKCTTVSGYAKICTKHTTQPNDYSEKYGSRYFNDEACSGHASGNTWGTETYEIIYYSITSTGSSVTNTIDRCTTENVGKLLSDGSLCIKDGDAQALGDANYVIYSYNGSEVINASDNLFVRKSITGLVNGVNVIDVSKAVPFALSNLATTALADDVASVRLYECDTSAKICNPTYGYIKSKETDKTESYFTIPYTGANAKVTAETGCSSKIGFIYKDTSNNQKLCLSATDNESAVVGSTKKIYQIKQTITAGNPFIATGSVDIVIEIGSNYMAMKTMPAGLHLYKIDTSTHEITDINYTGSDTIADADKTKLHFYNCNVSKCIETYGYVKVGSDYYKIAESGSDKIADGQNTCTEKNLGVIDTTGNNLCLGGTNTPIPFNTNNNEEAYHFMGNLNGNIFTGVGTDESTKKILIKSVKNALILDNLDLMDTKTYILKLGEEYKEYTCDGTKFTSAQDLATTVAEKIVEGVWLNVINDPSTATDKTKLALFNCASGTCTPNVGYVKSGSDYYAVHGSGAVLLDTESFVTCTSPADMGSMTSDGKVCLTANEDPAQALTVNGNGSYILSVATEHTGPLADVAGKNIILTASGSGAVFIYDNSIDSGPRVINTTTMKDQSLGGTLNAETDVPNIALFNCEKNGICKRTTGYVKDNGSAYYYIGESGSDNTDDSESTKFVGGCSESDNGKVDKNNDYKICGTDLAAFPDSDGQYLIYDGSSNYLFIRTIANAFTIVSIAATNIQETDVYGINASNGALINLGTATDDVLQANIEEMTLYYCEATDHTCTRTYGYFKANDKYFEVTAVADGKNGEVTVAAQCSGNVGKLLTGNNKLCIDATDDHAKAFSTGDIDYYFMTVTSPNIFSGSNGGAILVKSIANAFIIHTFGVVDGEDYIIKDGNDFKIHEYSSTTFSFTLQNDASEDTGIRVVQKVTDNASVIIDPSGTGNLADLALFNCASGVCTQTVGYVKDKDDKFYKVSASTTTELQAEDYVTCSTDGTPVGGLVSGGTLCLDGTSEIASSGIDDYLLDVPAGNDSVFSASAGKKIIVNVAANTITFTNNYSDGTKFCIVDDTLKKTTYDTGANCKSSSSGTPYECDADGYCVEESLD